MTSFWPNGQSGFNAQHIPVDKQKSSLISDCPLAFEALVNQEVVGLVLTRLVGLKPDLRANG